MADGKSDARPNGENVSAGASSRQRSIYYPRYTLAQAEEFAKAAFEVGARNCDQDRVAQKAGYSPTSGSYKSLRASATYFGLVETNSKGDLSVTDEWIEVFHSEDPQLLKRAKQEAVRRPPLYRQLLDEYATRHIPSLNKLAEKLRITPKYGIMPEAAEIAAKTFLESATYAGVIDDKGRVIPPDQLESEPANSQRNLFSHQNPNLDPHAGTITSAAQAPSPSQSNTPSNQSIDSSLQTVVITAGLDRYEVNLRGGQKAFLFLPPSITERDKKKLNGVIELLDIEEDSPSLLQSGMQYRQVTDQNNQQTGQMSIDDSDEELF